MEQAAPLYTTPSNAVQSALHTLKGSAHMAGVTAIAAIITPLENFFKELRSYQIRVDKDVLCLLNDTVAHTRQGLECIDRREPVIIEKQDEIIARVAELYERVVAPLIHTKDGAGHEGLGRSANPKLLALFMSEEMSLLLDADEYIEKWRDNIATLNSDIAPIQEELNTLITGAEQANLPLMRDLSTQLASIYQGLSVGAIAVNDQLFDVLKPAHEKLLDMVDQIAAGQNISAVEAGLAEGLAALVAKCHDQDLGPEEIADDTVLDLSEYGEDMAEVSSEELAPQADSELFVEGFNEDHVEAEVGPSEEFMTGFSAEEIEAAEEQVNNAQPSEPMQPYADTTAEDTDYAQDQDDASLDFSESVEQPHEESFDVGSEEVVIDEIESPPPYEPTPPVTLSVPTSDDPNDIAAIDAQDFDPDIREIFLEEATELIDELDDAIHRWESNWDNTDSPEAMKRALHTLKGGARLSGVTRLGDLTHDYESLLIATPVPTDAFFESIHLYQDTLLKGVRAVRSRLDGDTVAAVDAPHMQPPEPGEIPEEFRQTAQEPTAQVEEQDQKDKQDQKDEKEEKKSADVVSFVDRGMQHVAEQNQSLQEAAAVKRQNSQEMIKVSAELLEELVNLAGETSISRGRLEQQVSDLSTAVDEVDATLRRLNEQLRRLDIETEAQVLFRQEQMAQHEQFDPLEMDRYSHLQQLTRSLMESSSDLSDLKVTISDKLRDTETLLLQQQRINSSLQEGLMRSRMVPFSRLVPRLRRIVRQVAGELGKHVNFELDNVEGEMDRSVLERMVAPLEHMLRNAVDHGIESPAARQKANKPETGRILLSLAREGGDILLRLADDGRGVDLRRVREKAVERGLMAADAQLSDHDVLQFILQAGCSTAESVTQISGRGVGLDVVAAEIKQLGGSMVIDSKEGVGTQFVVRLPFTVSVNRALMVQLGSESYAIPLNTIEGIVRVSPFELEHYYTHEEARFEYASENYQVKYLGGMVSPGLKARLEGQLLPLPVILVRSGQQTMALQVDALSGSREIVVKSLGHQFAAVQGVSGATVMGDGSVVIILDPHALVRREMAQTGMNLNPLPSKATATLTHAPAHRTIMVVDDSVTVRKVTTRFLEREGFNVITAKDGVDALQVLQEATPDLMLLDIEMPRMDGFEVAKNMRSTQRWKRTPIIMITSRTGDKHREHAFSIGVNEYLGKPYQEETLLKTINALLDKSPVGA